MVRANYNRLSQEQHGFTLIELLVAIVILLIGIVATIGVFGSSKRTTLVAQRHEMGVHIAQREMEAMRSLRYSELGLNVTSGGIPAHSSDPNHPNFRIESNGTLRIRAGSGNPQCAVAPAGVCEQQVHKDNGAPNGKVESGGPSGEPFTVGEGTSAVNGRIFRYVTWRPETCAPLLCDPDGRDTKRLSVAVTLQPVGSPPVGPLKPIWETSIASDPNEGPTASNDPPPPPPPPPATSAQNFYLYDKTCVSDDGDNGYEAPTTSGDTDNTASAVAVCENVTPDRQPDLMGPVAPNYSNPPLPPFKYSNDVGGDYPAGLALATPGTGSSCPAASYPVSDSTDPTKPNKWSMHAWATKKFTQPFQLNGRVFLSLWTTSVGSLAGTGRFCATLVDRQNVGGVPNDIVLGYMSRDYTPWPTTKNEPGRDCGTPDFPCGRQLSFSTTITATSVRQDSRLVLVMSVPSTSDKDIVLLYDDPRYRSLLEVETSTPCSSSAGAPCPPS